MGRLGSEISRLRKEIGMTQKQLAKTVGVSETFILDVESGRKVLNSDMIARINKALRLAVGKLDLFEEEEHHYKPEPVLDVVKVIEKPVQQIWNDALAGIIMQVPIYDLTFRKTLGTRALPIIPNKVEDLAKDKVFYLEIPNDEMIGLRIAKGDRALAFSTKELDKDGIYIVEYNGTRFIKQIKKISQNKILLSSNNGVLKTLTVSQTDIKVVAKLIRLEVIL